VTQIDRAAGKAKRRTSGGTRRCNAAARKLIRTAKRHTKRAARRRDKALVRALTPRASVATVVPMFTLHEVTRRKRPDETEEEHKARLAKMDEEDRARDEAFAEALEGSSGAPFGAYKGVADLTPYIKTSFDFELALTAAAMAWDVAPGSSSFETLRRAARSLATTTQFTALEAAEWLKSQALAGKPFALVEQVDLTP